MSASDRIRYRLVGAGRRYHANDNIAAFIEEGELQELMTEVQGKMQEVLHALVIDTARDHNIARNGAACRQNVGDRSVTVAAMFRCPR